LRVVRSAQPASRTVFDRFIERDGAVADRAAASEQHFPVNPKNCPNGCPLHPHLMLRFLSQRDKGESFKFGNRASAGSQTRFIAEADSQIQWPVAPHHRPTRSGGICEVSRLSNFFCEV